MPCGVTTRASLLQPRAQLFTHRADVDQLNAAELARCAGERVTFEARDEGSSEALAACLVRPHRKHLMTAP
jgi:hypothetical protein